MTNDNTDGVALFSTAHPRLPWWKRPWNTLQVWIRPKLWRWRGVTEEVEIEIKDE